MQVRTRVLLTSIAVAFSSQLISLFVIKTGLLPLYTNTGIAFSLPFTGPLQIILSGVLLLTIIIYAPILTATFDPSSSLMKIVFFHIHPRRLAELSLALIVGGGLSNLGERLIYGYVVDYIDVGFWPVFNMADSFITIGAILIAVLWLKK